MLEAELPLCQMSKAQPRNLSRDFSTNVTWGYLWAAKTNLISVVYILMICVLTAKNSTVQKNHICRVLQCLPLHYCVANTHGDLSISWIWSTCLRFCFFSGSCSVIFRGISQYWRHWHYIDRGRGGRPKRSDSPSVNKSVNTSPQDISVSKY